MKILVFCDTHGDLFLLEEAMKKEKDAEFTICLGDTTIFNQDIELIFEELTAFQKPLYMMFGNHEYEEDVEELCKLHKFNFMHKSYKQINGYDFLFFGGDGFSRRDKDFEKTMKKLAKKCNPEKTILCLHGPPINTKLDVPFEDHHSGSESYREFIEKFKPLLALAGHIHEGEHEHDMIGKTFLVNPGPDGEIFDLEELHKQRIKSKKK